MKTRQEYMLAKFTTRHENARNMTGEKETVSRIVLIDKKTEREIVDCRIYMSASRNASTVYASIWVQGIKTGKHPADWPYGETSGRGSAGGGGYHKQSAAVGDAIRSAGIELYGSPYASRSNGDSHEETKAMLKKPTHINGCGDGSIRAALLAIANAAGYSDVIAVGI